MSLTVSGAHGFTKLVNWELWCLRKSRLGNMNLRPAAETLASKHRRHDTKVTQTNESAQEATENDLNFRSSSY